MRIYLALDVSPDDGERPAHSEAIIESLEPELEVLGLEVANRVYDIKILGSGKNFRGLTDSMRMRRQR